jgi:hypothetical protein
VSFFISSVSSLGLDVDKKTTFKWNLEDWIHLAHDRDQWRTLKCYLKFGFHKMLGIYWKVGQLLASQGRLGYKELVFLLHIFWDRNEMAILCTIMLGDNHESFEPECERNKWIPSILQTQRSDRLKRNKKITKAEQALYLNSGDTESCLVRLLAVLTEDFCCYPLPLQETHRIIPWIKSNPRVPNRCLLTIHDHPPISFATI